MLWENLREEEFEKAIEISKGVCVMPIGCVEMHGQHLPVGTDFKTSEYIAREADKIEPVMIFPTFRFGDLQGLTYKKGSVILSVELEQRLLTELCSEIARNGFKKIVLLNGHGGNVAMLGNFVRSTQREKKDYVVMARNDFCYTVNELVRDLDAGMEFPELTAEDIAYVRDFVYTNKQTGHGCINETSIMMHITPDLVRLDRMHEVDGVSTGKADYLHEVGFNMTSRFWGINQPNSYHGHHPDGANARIGKVLLDKRIEVQAEACRRLKMDNRVLEWNEAWNNSWEGRY